MGKIMEKIKQNWEILIWLLPIPEVGQVVVDIILGITIPIALIWGIKRYGPRVRDYLGHRKIHLSIRE